MCLAGNTVGAVVLFCLVNIYVSFLLAEGSLPGGKDHVLWNETELVFATNGWHQSSGAHSFSVSSSCPHSEFSSSTHGFLELEEKRDSGKWKPGRHLPSG